MIQIFKLLSAFCISFFFAPVWVFAHAFLASTGRISPDLLGIDVTVALFGLTFSWIISFVISCSLVFFSLSCATTPDKTQAEV